MFNMDLYIQIRRERERLGLPVGPTNIELPDHDLVGREVYDNIKNRTGTIQSVNRQWYSGWYLVAILNFDGSHGMVYWENLTKCDVLPETIKDGIEYTKQRYQLL